ncbi:MAG TPA: NAD(P)-binding protein, partial [Leptospiraceae bacterium]|nr:NAD(P)-binding protein [Leptospiraceae bacterium]
MKDSIVIGGGLAGPIAANIAARAGLSVTVVEKSKSLGGRARSAVRDQFIFNQGPHALYIRGNLARTLSDLGIKVTGKKEHRAERTSVAKANSPLCQQTYLDFSLIHGFPEKEEWT